VKTWIASGTRFCSVSTRPLRKRPWGSRGWTLRNASTFFHRRRELALAVEALGVLEVVGRGCECRRDAGPEGNGDHQGGQPGLDQEALHHRAIIS
jgi:hypothetical protein